jgi:uncharacterized LabA/DUF88 family protein
MRSVCKINNIVHLLCDINYIKQHSEILNINKLITYLYQNNINNIQVDTISNIKQVLYTILKTALLNCNIKYTFILSSDQIVYILNTQIINLPNVNFIFWIWQTDNVQYQNLQRISNLPNIQLNLLNNISSDYKLNTSSLSDYKYTIKITTSVVLMSHDITILTSIIKDKLSVDVYILAVNSNIVYLIICGQNIILSMDSLKLAINNIINDTYQSINFEIELYTHTHTNLLKITNNEEISNERISNVYIFIDNANVFIQAKKMYATQHNLLSIQDARCRIDVNKMCNLIANTREIVCKNVYDSSKYLHSFYKNTNTNINKSYRSKYTNKDKMTDTHMCVDIVNIGNHYIINKTIDTIIILSGDADMIPAINQLLENGYKVEVWSWSNSISRKSYREHDNLSICMFDEYINDIIYINPLLKYIPSSAILYNYTFNDDIILNTQFMTDFANKVTTILRWPVRVNITTENIHNELVISLGTDSSKHDPDYQSKINYIKTHYISKLQEYLKQTYNNELNTNKAEEVYIYIDNSNMFVQAKKTYATKMNMIISEDPRCRINIENLCEVVSNKRKIANKFVYDTGEIINTIYNNYDIGHNITDIYNNIIKSNINKSKDTVIILSGNTAIRSTIEQLLDNGYKIEIWTWSNSLSHKLYQDHATLSVYLLDIYINEIIYIDTLLKKKPSILYYYIFNDDIKLNKQFMIEFTNTITNIIRWPIRTKLSTIHNKILISFATDSSNYIQSDKQQLKYIIAHNLSNLNTYLRAKYNNTLIKY